MTACNNRPPETFHSDNALEYTSQHLQSFLNHICTKQTTIVPHHPQMNGLAERVNLTIMNAARCAIAHANIEPTLWQFAVMDAVYKYNIMPHYIAKAAPASKWMHNWTPPSFVFPFCTIGMIPDPRPKLKLANRGCPVRFLYNICNKIICVLMLDTHKTATARLEYLKPHHPNLDPATTLASAIQCKFTAPPPSTSKTGTAQAISLQVARLYPYCDKWEIAHNA